MRKYCFAILKSESNEDYLEWVQAIKNSRRDLEYDIIDFIKSDWLDRVNARNYDCFLTRPPGTISYYKQLYDERIFILHSVLNKKIYPTLEEILIYENKRMLAYWLEANQIPHAKTHIIYDKKEALEFCERTAYPFIAKTAIGASGSGVQIMESKRQALRYIRRAFSDKGIVRKWKPNLRKGKIKKRIKGRLHDIPGFIDYLKRRYHQATVEPQRWFVIFQDYLDVINEWRSVRIGDSFFAHKKQRRGKIFSGGGGIDWEGPSADVLDFMKMVTDKRGFLSQAIDIFVDSQNKLYINELQCFFGFIHPEHQMIIDGVPGRYVYDNGKWKFEQGTYNRNNSFDLRLEHIIELLDNGKL